MINRGLRVLLLIGVTAGHAIMAGSPSQHSMPSTASVTPANGLILLHDNSGGQILRLYYRGPTIPPDDPVTSAALQVSTPLHRSVVLARRERLIRSIVDVLDSQTAVRAATFGQRILISREWQRTAKELLESFDSVMQRGGPSPMWDALVEVAGALENIRGDRTILLITDGRASGNRTGFDETVRLLKASRVTVHVAVLDAKHNREANRDRPGDPTDRLQTLVISTGGRYAEPELADLPAACARLLRQN